MFITNKEKKMETGKIAQTLIFLMKTVADLKKVNRAGWNKKKSKHYKKTKVKNPESVADHSYGLMFLCMIVGDLLGLDVAKLFIMATLHDLMEAIDGDEITATEKDEVKRKLLEGNKRIREEELMKKFLSPLGTEMADKYFSIFIEYLDNETKEAKIAYQLDKIETILQSYDYKKDGEKVYPEEFVESYRSRISEPLLVEILNALEEGAKIK